ncbi:MFS transporter [Aspergillus niger]|nr:MFS transporter [Aspergillus niger]
MASLRPGPTEAISVSSGSSSTPQYTPVSDRSENDGSPNPNRPTAGSLRVQTAFSSDGESFTDDGFDEGYESYEDVQPLSSSRTSMPKYTKEEEKGVIKQFDRKLVPFLALLYLLSFLDRSNIGNAKIAGLADDLHLSSSQYEWLLTAFYITYILFEWMTLMYKVVPPHIYIALCVCGWGLVASLQSLATSFGALVFLRAALGITEAAFGPGVPFYLSLFYKREELAFRNGLFISAAPLASSFASSLAWLIVRVSDNGPIAPWRTLFLVEGFPSIIVAVFAWIVIPDTPGSASFLNPRQRAIAQLRMDELKPNRKPHQQQSQQRKSFNWKEVKKTLADPKSYITAFMFFSCNVAFSSMPVFLPTIIQDMGYSSLTSQALSAPPYLLSFLTVLLTSHLSDRTRTRSPYLIFHALLSATAYAAIALAGHFHSSLPSPIHVAIRYLAVYPATSGFFSAITLIITWTMDNRPANEGKGASVALLNVIGQCGPLLGTRLYPASQGPWYVSGMAVCAGFMVLVAALAGLLRWLLGREMRGREMGKGDDGDEDGIELEEGGGEEREVLMGYIGERGGGGDSGGREKFTYIL